MDRAQVTPIPGLEREGLLQEIFTRIDREEFDSYEIEQIRHDFHKDIALRLIETGQGMEVVMGFDKFQGLDREIALKLIEAGPVYDCAWGVFLHLEQFPGLDIGTVAEILRKNGI